MMIPAMRMQEMMLPTMKMQAMRMPAMFPALGIEQSTSLSITSRELVERTQLSHEIQSNTNPTTP